MTAARPRVTLKLATSLDGRIATASGKSRWITGEVAREQSHRLRAEHDAILIGIGTARADNPSLTVRLDDFDGEQPVRVVLDTRLRLHPDSELATTAKEIPVIVFCSERAPGINASVLAAKGVTVKKIRPADGGVCPEAVLAGLAEDGVKSVFVEGGGQVAASFIKAGLVDALEWFRAPVVLGGDGVAGIGDLDMDAPGAAPRFRLQGSTDLGGDVWDRYVPVRE